ncbi:hypothetical protein CEXT_245741 [Caerostris extrusa]|uniref:Uncharacterized protein n=1 Tax=Caerostris extrusa TaxID=172846 RepID=A0AAV4XIU6_CAEEX|nr:hypothetical protein CEXT_245741 [Caerostris extrusa]
MRNTLRDFSESLKTENIPNLSLMTLRKVYRSLLPKTNLHSYASESTTFSSCVSAFSAGANDITQTLSSFFSLLLFRYFSKSKSSGRILLTDSSLNTRFKLDASREKQFLASLMQRTLST